MMTIVKPFGILDDFTGATELGSGALLFVDYGPLRKLSLVAIRFVPSSVAYS